MRFLVVVLACLVAPGLALAGVHPNTAAITIPDGAQAATYPSEITVSGEIGGIHRLEVTLHGLSHDNPDDLDFLLVGPGDYPASVFMSDACGTTPISSLELSFDSRTVAPLSDDGPCASGTFEDTNLGGVADMFPPPAPDEPDSRLADFHLSIPNGTYSLYAIDDEMNGAGGMLAGGWSLEIETSIVIPDAFEPPEGANPYPAEFEVPVPGEGIHASISDVNVALDGLTYDGLDDLDFLLVGPTGANATIVSDACGGVGAGLDWTLDDEAAAALPDDGPCPTGPYQPADYAGGGTESFPAPAPTPSGSTSLSVFDATDPSGTWSLYIADDSFRESAYGELVAWSLDITENPTATAVTSFRARRARSGVAVSWRTAQEVGLLGFNVYRSGRRLNSQLIRAKAMGTIAGASYRFVDRTARLPGTHTYRLETVSFAVRSWYGSSTVLASRR